MTPSAARELVARLEDQIAALIAELTKERLRFDWFVTLECADLGLFCEAYGHPTFSTSRREADPAEWRDAMDKIMAARKSAE